MRSHLTTTALILVLALALAAAATGGELPAQAQRIWAPAGDEIGQENHAAATLVISDVRGDEAKVAEDWSVLGKSFGFGLFNYQRRNENSHLFAVRGAGGNLESSGLAGDVALWSTAPGVYGLRVAYSSHDLYYDRDSELRSPDFVADPTLGPPVLGFLPHLTWRRGTVDLRYQLNDRLQVRGGISDLRREGRKSSLLRGTWATRDFPPGVQTVDTKVYEVWVGGAYSNGPLASELRLSYRGSDGIRDYAGSQPHAYDEERKEYRASLAAAYDLGPTSRLLAHGAMARLEHLGQETWGQGRAGAVDGDTETQVGQLAFLSRVGAKTTVRASARFSGQQSDIRIDEQQSILYAADRTRDRQDFRLVVDNTGLPDTRVRLQYRYSKTNQEGVTAQDGRPGDWNQGDSQTLDQKTTRQDLSLASRTRLGRQTRLKLGLQWTGVDVDQVHTWDTASSEPWYGVLGDHQRSRLAWEASLQTRPHRNLPVDFGYQGRDQTFERTEAGGETTWQASRLFVNANWLADSRLTVYGMATYGKETYELTGAEDPIGTMGAFNYDGETWRFMPGAVVTLTRTLQLEGMVEMIRYENTADASASLDPVKADHDRGLVRARWQARPQTAVTLGYQRRMFDENRWDDYIQDLYTVTVSGRF